MTVRVLIETMTPPAPGKPMRVSAVASPTSFRNEAEALAFIAGHQKSERAPRGTRSYRIVDEAEAQAVLTAAPSPARARLGSST